MAHYDCSCCGESMGVAHEYCDFCKSGNCQRAQSQGDAFVTDKAMNLPFEREERYIVVKRKHLTALQETSLRAHLSRLGIGTVECVVVESDWPEHETVWQMIEDRCTGKSRTGQLVPREAVEGAEQRGKEKAISAVLAYLRDQEAKGAKIALAAEDGSGRRAAYGGGSYALHLAANSIEAEGVDEWLTMCIGCDRPIGHKDYAIDDNGETGCPACFTDDGSGECWNHAALASLKPESHHG